MERYAEYKDSGVEWIGYIPSHWESLQLKYLLQEKKHVSNSLLSCGSISFGEVVKKNDESIPEERKLTYQEVLRGEFLVNPLNLNYDLKSLRIALSGLNVVVSPGYLVLQLDESQDKHFFEFLLRHFDTEHMKSLGAGVRQTISFTHLKNELLICPPKSEQIEIGRFLDERTGWIDEAVKKTEKKITLLKEQRASLINEVVTKGLDSNVEMKDSGVEWIGDIPNHWSLSRLASLTSGLESGVSANSIDTVVSEEGQLAILKTSCVSRGVFEIDQHKVVLKEEHNRLKCPVQAGSIIVSRMNTPALVGASAYVDQDASYLFLPDRLWQVYIDVVGVVPKLLGYVVGSVGFRRLLSSISVGSSPSMKNIPQEAFLKSIVPVGPVEEQERIVAFLDERTGMMDEVIAKEEERITLLKQYRQSLISEVVTGKRRVLDEPVGLN